MRYHYATPVLWDGVGGIEPPIFRSKYLPPTVRPCGIPESNGVLRFGGPPCDLHTHAAMLPPGFEPGSPRRGRGMHSVAPQQRCRQPESNRRPTFEGRRCLTALHHDGVAAPRFARGPRLCKSRILTRPCCHRGAQEKRRAYEGKQGPSSGVADPSRLGLRLMARRPPQWTREDSNPDHTLARRTCFRCTTGPSLNVDSQNVVSENAKRRTRQLPDPQHPRIQLICESDVTESQSADSVLDSIPSLAVLPWKYVRPVEL